MNFYYGLLLILLSLVWFYYVLTKQSDKTVYKWYALQRNLFGAIILFLLGLILMLDL